MSIHNHTGVESVMKLQCKPVQNRVGNMLRNGYAIQYTCFYCNENRNLLCLKKKINGFVVVLYGDKRDNSSIFNYHNQYICSVT